MCSEVAKRVRGESRVETRGQSYDFQCFRLLARPLTVLF